MEGCLEEKTQQNLGGHGRVSGPGYMRNPNPKRAKMSFLSYNRHEIVFVDLKCRIPFLATQNVLLLPGSKSGMGPFQGHNHCHRT